MELFQVERIFNGTRYTTNANKIRLPPKIFCHVKISFSSQTLNSTVQTGSKIIIMAALPMGQSFCPKFAENNENSLSAKWRPPPKAKFAPTPRFASFQTTANTRHTPRQHKPVARLPMPKSVHFGILIVQHKKTRAHQR